MCILSPADDQACGLDIMAARRPGRPAGKTVPDIDRSSRLGHGAGAVRRLLSFTYMHAHASNAQGEALVNELKWVHRLIRRDLATVRGLAADLRTGLSGGDAAAMIQSLEVASPLWHLRINCLQYCRFVHAHHHAESVLLFPRLRSSNPALGPVVDKLEADHARVPDLLDQVSTVAADLAGQEQPATRKRLIDALDDLSTVLLAHLDYEEEHIADTLRTWAGWGW